MRVTLDGIVTSPLTPATSMDPSFEQSKPLRELYEGLDASTENDFSPLQPENAPPPMLVTLSGIVMLVRPLQPLNAKCPMLVTLSGIVTLVSPSQPLNAESPMLVTLPGIITSLRLKQ
jgi:hypothetical protein